MIFEVEKYNVGGCFGKESLGNLKEWWSVEVIIFYANIILLSFLLLGTKLKGFCYKLNKMNGGEYS